MACGCGRAATRREVLRTTRNAPTRHGGYLLLSYPDCTTLHTGTHRGDSLYVVARNVPDQERLFTRQHLTEATQYAIDIKGAIENIPCTALCDEAVNAVFASV
jgi:hypothetical protein